MWFLPAAAARADCWPLPSPCGTGPQAPAAWRGSQHVILPLHSHTPLGIGLVHQNASWGFLLW